MFQPLLRSPAPRPSRRRRLSCEPLEARDVPSSVAGTVFNDLNENGVQESGEAGFAGWTAFLDNNRNGLLEPGEASTVTGADGTFTIIRDGVTPAVGSTGVEYDVVTLVLETGTGGRWLNTTALAFTTRRDTEPDAVRNFGVVFRSDAAAGFAPAGPEQLVNAVTGGVQGSGTEAGLPVSVATDANGNYVVAWRTAVAGVSDQVFARLFNSDGTPRTGDLLVSSEPAPAANAVTELPTVGMADNGRFVVGWASTAGPKVRVYAADGAPVTAAVVVAASSSTVGNHFADLAVDADGDFVVVYGQSTKSKNWGWGTPAVKAQRFTAAGAPTGKVISVASLTLYNGLQSVAMTDAGAFAVVYDDAANGTTGVYAQRYSASGQKVGGLITVAAAPYDSTVWQSNIAMAGGGDFVVSWYSKGSAGDFARVYNADGTPAGQAVQVSQGGMEKQTGLAIDDGGTVTLAWTDTRGVSFSNGAGEVRVRRLTAAGGLMRDTLANATTPGSQRTPGMAATPAGGFIAAWQGYGPGDDAGIFAQHFVPVAPLTAAAPAAGTEVAPLTDAQLQPIVREAVRRWNRTGLTGAERTLLQTVTVRVADLDGLTLGQAAGTTVTIDPTAAGHGWFVDPTPRSDSEFRRPGDQGEQGKMDLLTTVMHELGHVLGKAHADDGVMAETLAAGTRESVVPGVAVGRAAKAAPVARPGWFLSSGRARR